MSYQKDVLGTGPRQGGISSHFALFLVRLFFPTLTQWGRTRSSKRRLTIRLPTQTSKEANCHTICPRSSVCHLCSQRVRSHLACILLHTCERFPALPSLETSSIQVMAMRYVNSTSSACTHASVSTTCLAIQGAMGMRSFAFCPDGLTSPTIALEANRL